MLALQISTKLSTLSCSVLLWLATPSAASGLNQQELRNSSFLPTSQAAETALARGDAAWLELLEEGQDRGGNNPTESPSDDLRWNDVFDAWQSALENSTAGESVSANLAAEGSESHLLADLDGTAEHRSEGVERAVRRRLQQLSRAQQEGWSARYESLGQERFAQVLSSAGSERLQAAARLERQLPCTPYALLACLVCFELHFERGETAAADFWFRRAIGQFPSSYPTHWRLPLSDGWQSASLAWAVRRDLWNSHKSNQVSAPPLTSTEAWRTAQQITPASTGSGLLDLGGSSSSRLGFGIHPRPVVLPGPNNSSDSTPSSQGNSNSSSSRLLWQGSHRAVIIDSQNLSTHAVWELDEVLSACPQKAGRCYAPHAQPGWALAPRLHGEQLILLHGRSSLSGANILACIQPPDPNDSAIPVPSLVWAVQGDQHIDSTGQVRSIAELQELTVNGGLLEFQPTPLVHGGLVLMQLRLFTELNPNNQATDTDLEDFVGRGPATGRGLDRPALRAAGDIKSYAVAFDATSGEFRWLRYISKGRELRRDLGRFGMAPPESTASQELVLIPKVSNKDNDSSFARSDSFFAGTHLGTGARLDWLDGRVHWTLKNGRRIAADESWAGQPAQSNGTELAWTPADGEELFWLECSPNEPGRESNQQLNRVLAKPSQPVGSALALIDSTPNQALLLSQVGPRSTLATWNGTTGERRNALYLDAKEDIAGLPLTSKERVWLSTNRALYLFDRTRDNLLIDVKPYPRSQVPAGQKNTDPDPQGGHVFAFDNSIYVLDSQPLRGTWRLWHFLAR